MEFRLRGNDVIFARAEGDEESRSALETNQSEIPRTARNDKDRLFLQPVDRPSSHASQSTWNTSFMFAHHSPSARVGIGCCMGSMIFHHS